MGFSFNTITSTLRTVGHQISPIVTPIKKVATTALKVPIGIFQSTSKISQNVLKTATNASGALVSLTSGNGIIYLGLGVGILAVIYVLKK